MPKELFAKNLKLYLAKYNLSRHELARRMNVNRGIPWTWTSGRSWPSLDQLVKLCELLQVESIDKFLRTDMTQPKAADAKVLSN